MPDVARNHHYLPQCYLRGFQRLNQKKGRSASVHVFDIKTGKRFATAIRNVGAVRDFNRIESADHPPDVLENVWSSLENDFSNVLNEMKTHLAMPTGEGLNILFNFMVQFATHNPRFRKNFNDFQTRVIHKMMDLALADKERWEARKRKMKEDGDEVDNSISYEELKQFNKERRYEVVPLLWTVWRRS